MKQLTCEMCGSTDLLKQDGVFVCQTCGTKYSVEEAKKMMIEGTVDVSGSTVKVDNSASIKNFYTLAVSAYEAENQEEAESYCNKIIEINPENYEAWFLKGKAAGWQSTVGRPRLEESTQCFRKAIEYAPQDSKDDLIEQIYSEIEKISISLIVLFGNHLIKFPSEDNSKSIISCAIMIKETSHTLFEKCGFNNQKLMDTICDLIEKPLVSAWNTVLNNYGTNPSYNDASDFIDKSGKYINLFKTIIAFRSVDSKDNITTYKELITIYEKRINYQYRDDGYLYYILTDSAREGNVNEIMTCHQAIHKMDSSYVIPEKPTFVSNEVQNEKIRKAKKAEFTWGFLEGLTSGCYVATCVYGSYDCPQVWTLRRYRDYTLAETWYGRAFIRLYYAISPTIVKLFGNTNWFKKMWKGKLDKMVAHLQAKGVENTPYNDREW